MDFSSSDIDFLSNTEQLYHAIKCELLNWNDWNDMVAMKGGREVLRKVQYPNDATRRSLYTSWLRVVASNRWQQAFDHVMLECVAATPSPTSPEKPLFADFYSERDAVDLISQDVLTPVLSLAEIPRLFVPRPVSVEPLPSSPGLVDFLADLIKKGSRDALNEAGLIISFYSLALSLVVALPVREVQDFLRTRMKSALAAAVPTSFDGDAFCPNGRFLTELARKACSTEGEVKPYIVLLVIGQYAYHCHVREVPPSGDMSFLEEGFLTAAKFSGLKMMRLLYDVQEKTALSAEVLNGILRDSGSQEVAQSSERVREFLEGAKDMMQKMRPWCRTTNVCFLIHLDVIYHLDYVMRLAAFLAPDPNDLLWHCPEFANVPASRLKDARIWARNFKRNLRKGKYGPAVKLDQL